MSNVPLEMKSPGAREVMQLRRDVTRLSARIEALALKFQRHGKPVGGNKMSPMISPLNFSERVKVVSLAPAAKPVFGKAGTILGRAPADDTWIYTVWIDDENECWSLAQNELKRVGDEAAGDHPAVLRHVRVKVDARGRGSVAL